jgi:O-methyltransferase involved in polyketide biosynthesis
VVEEKGAQQVLELAGGLAPRGMEFAPRGIVYVEADLEESTRMKREVVTAVLGKVPEGLHLCTANVLDRAQLLACCAPFSEERPVAVTAEGLLRYLTFDEKKRVAGNVLEILQRYGGWWITPDVHLRSWALRQSPADRQSERERLGRDLLSNYFDDLDHAHQFFDECGFVVETRPILEGVREQITAPPSEERRAEMEQYRLFVLTAKG